MDAVRHSIAWVLRVYWRAGWCIRETAKIGRTRDDRTNRRYCSVQKRCLHLGGVCGRGCGGTAQDRSGAYTFGGSAAGAACECETRAQGPVGGSAHAVASHLSLWDVYMDGYCVMRYACCLRTHYVSRGGARLQ